MTDLRHPVEPTSIRPGIGPETLPLDTRSGQALLRKRRVRPLPQPDELTRPFWDAATRGELRIMRCARCHNLRHPPSEHCRSCGAVEHDWPQLSGDGVIYSYVVDHRLLVPGFDEPYVVVQVNPVEATDETVRITGNLDGVAHDAVRVGMAVTLTFVTVGGIALPHFRAV